MPDQETGLVPAGQSQTSIEKKQDAQAGKLSRLGAFTPTNLTEAIALSKLIASSELAPKDYKSKPANVLIAMQMGAEVGLAPMQALQNIAVINGRPSLWGDAALGIVQVSPMYEWHKEEIRGEGDLRTAFCVVKRKNQEAYTASFSVGQAKKAQLWGKPGPWQTYPDRMLQMRARGYALRDKFSDALRGLILAEEAMDIPVDTSEAKKQRDVAALDVSTLTPSTEVNRGHNDTGFEQKQPDTQNQETKKPDDVMCAECSVINGHAETCSQKVSEYSESPTMRLTISGPLKRWKKGDKTWAELPAVLEDGTEIRLTIWHKSLAEKLKDVSKGFLRGEVSTKEKSGKTFYNLEHIVMLNGKQFVNDEPVEAEGELEDGIPADEIGFEK